MCYLLTRYDTNRPPWARERWRHDHWLPILVLLFAPWSIHGQEESIEVATQIVNVPVIVMDRNGLYVPGLEKKDFSIFEDGIKQEITSFRKVEQPFTVMLLLDMSGYFEDFVPGVAKASAEFVAQLRPEDTIIVAYFKDDSKIHILLEPTKRRDFKKVIPLKSALGDSYTTTFDAVESALKYLEVVEGKKSLVLFADGTLYGRKSSAKENLKDAEESEVTIFTVRYGEYPIQPGYTQAIMPDYEKRFGNKLGITKKEMSKLLARVDAYMFGLAERTGGRGFKLNSLTDLPGTFKRIADELGQQYELGYLPERAAKREERRKIVVKVNRPETIVRSRNEVVFRK